MVVEWGEYPCCVPDDCGRLRQKENFSRMESIMRLTLSALMLLVCGVSSQAEALELFQKLQPVSHLFGEPACDTSVSDCTDDTCHTSGCRSHSCGCRTAPAPTMIGGSSLGVPFSLSDNFEAHLFPNFYSRVAENNSAIPQNRVFFNYKFLNDVPIAKDILANARDYDSDFSHYELGLEKTLFNGNVSVELLVPFSYGPESSVPNTVGLQGSDVELQNIAFGLKALLLANDSKAISAGVRIEAPTKEDIHFSTSGFTSPNEVWAVTPYLATLINLNDDLFFQAFASYRLQTDDFTTSSPDLPLREPNYFDLDAQLGYWLYRNTGGSGLTGLQAKTEIHYTGTFEPYQGPTSPALPGVFGETDQLNLTTGLTAIMNDRTTITAGMVLPVRDGSDLTRSGAVRPHPSDRFFDWQANLQVNYYFGNQ